METFELGSGQYCNGRRLITVLGDPSLYGLCTVGNPKLKGLVSVSGTSRRRPSFWNLHSVCSQVSGMSGKGSLIPDLLRKWRDSELRK